jgi:hypothetical protein
VRARRARRVRAPPPRAGRRAPNAPKSPPSRNRARASPLCACKAPFPPRRASRALSSRPTA